MSRRLLFTVVLTFLALGLVSLAQDASLRIQPTAHLAQGAATLRTPEMMDRFEAATVAPTPRIAPFRPTMDAATYRSLKQQAAASGTKSNASFGPSGPLSPPVTGAAFAGPSEGQGSGQNWVPPDVAGSPGTFNEFVSVENSLFAVYDLTTHAQRRLISLNAFFGYSAQPFFDPRVIFDSVWSRWCITAPAFPNSATSQILGIACSANGDALGGWHVYLVDLGFLGGSGGFYDFPMIGDSQDAIIFTANVFTSSTFQGSSLFAIRKARVFTGRNIGGEPIYTGLQATLQPARELLDGNGYAWLAAANGSGNIAMYAMGYPASPPDTTLNGYNVTVNPYAAPPAAPQQSPCTGATNNLDTSDARFVNTGVQNGDLYYQVHTITDITATPRYYIIKGLLSFTPTVQEFGEFYANATSSSDFNASIGADGGNRVVVNWTSVDAANHVNPQVRFSGKLPTDGLIAGPGTVLTTSAACLSGNYDPNFGEQRWGDYSQSVVGPTSPQFWIENETVVNTNTWGTEIGMIHF